MKATKVTEMTKESKETEVTEETEEKEETEETEEELRERAWIELNLGHLTHNARVLQEAMQPGCRLMAVVKANAYGHGEAQVAAALNRIGVEAFAVATIEEGIRLRTLNQGIKGEILILGYTSPRRAKDLETYDLTQTMISLDYGRELSRQKANVKVHIKIDTGMHRLGISADAKEEILEAFRLPNLSVCGMYTHLCCADSSRPTRSVLNGGSDLPTSEAKGHFHSSRPTRSVSEDETFTREQVRRFYDVVSFLKKENIPIPLLHIQSSYGLLNYPEFSSGCGYVRAGIALYGVLSAPGEKTKLTLDLRPALSLKARVVLIRTVKKGDTVGYGRAFRAKRDTRIAILPIGYADGYPRSLSNGEGAAVLRGVAVPVVGRVCMDQMAVDVTDVTEVSVGDIAVLIGSGPASSRTNAVCAEEVAARSGSISNELLSRLGTRLPIVETGAEEIEFLH